jgi:hypothetical protein
MPNLPAEKPWSARLFRWHVLAAHANLLLAFGWTALRPDGLATSPLHPDVLACAHLVTLGCVATTAVGAFHVVQPLAMRQAPRASWRDWFLLVALQLAASGVAAHMALGTYGGVAWSAGLLLAALLPQTVRWQRALRFADAPAALRAGTALALLNLLLAVVLGALLAIDRGRYLFPAGHHAVLVAHAHLALGGFAGTLVAAIGLRLLPMFLPAAPARGPLPWFAVLGLGIGGLVCGTVAPFLPAGIDAGGALLVLGGLAWVWLAPWFLTHRKPPHQDLANGDPAHVLLLAGGISFAGALALGTSFLLGDGLDPHWRTAYGVLLLVGGFGSFVLGMGQRLLPLAARVHGGPSKAMGLPGRRAAYVAAIGWAAGLATMVVGVLAGSTAGVGGGAAMLGAAVAVDLVNVLRVRTAA